MFTEVHFEEDFMRVLVRSGEITFLDSLVESKINFFL